MPQVRFDPTFFRKERDTNYYDWKSAFWRELFQNAVDQHADRIHITIKDSMGPFRANQRTPTVVTFSDNGPGMTRKILDDVYFAFGATSKTGQDQIGGMGRARALTCFAMQSYYVRSQDYMVIGVGGDYEVHTAEHFHGCALTIEIDDATVEEMADKLHEFLGECRLNQTAIFLNDRLLTKRAEYQGRYIKDLFSGTESFAKVFVNKSAGQHRAIVRVNGVSMYTTDITAKAQVIIELNPATARQALTANRDGLRGECQRAYTAFIRQLASETTSLLKDRFKRHTKAAWEGGVMRRVRKASSVRPTTISASPVSTTRFDPQTMPPVTIVPNTLTNDVHGTISSIIRPTVIDLADRRDPIDEENTSGADLGRDVFNDWLRRTFGAVYISDETDNKKMHAVVPNYLPENWKIRMGGIKGGNITKILLAWQTAISYTLEVSMNVLSKSEIAYAVGFVFKNQTAAECQSRDGGHVFYLCPVDDDGKLKYALTKRRALKEMMSHAKHEVAHVTQTWHDEEFCDVREAIDIEFDEAECFRRIKNAIDAIPDFDRQERMAA